MGTLGAAAVHISNSAADAAKKTVALRLGGIVVAGVSEQQLGLQLCPLGTARIAQIAAHEGSIVVAVVASQMQFQGIFSRMSSRISGKSTCNYDSVLYATHRGRQNGALLSS